MSSKSTTLIGFHSVVTSIAIFPPEFLLCTDTGTDGVLPSDGSAGGPTEDRLTGPHSQEVTGVDL